MADNELTVQTGGLVSVIQNQGLDSVIKPLFQEIYLFDSYVAGTTHLEDKSVLETLKPDDKLTLQREDNEFDSNAILIMNGEGKKIGYVPEKDNIVFARLMDARKMLIAKISKISQKGDFTKINIGIYLVDF